METDRLTDDAQATVALRPGRPAYYLVRCSPGNQRDRIAAVCLWDEQLQRIRARASDPGAARLKLDWWRDELARIAAGEGRHPLAQGLAPALQGVFDLSPWLTMLAETDRLIRDAQPSDLADFADSCGRYGGALAGLLNDEAAAPSAMALAQGRYAEAVRRVSELGAALRRGQCPLPRDWLVAHRIPVADLLELRTPAELGRNLDALLLDLLPSTARGRSTAGDRSRCTSRRLGAQAAALHRAMRADGFAVIQRRYALSPIRSLWAAWRA